MSSTEPSQEPSLPVVVVPAQMDEVQTALWLAVMHHGLSNLAQKAAPASKETVATTAAYFLAKLSLLRKTTT